MVRRTVVFADGFTFGQKRTAAGIAVELAFLLVPGSQHVPV